MICYVDEESFYIFQNNSLEKVTFETFKNFLKQEPFLYITSHLPWTELKLLQSFKNSFKVKASFLNLSILNVTSKEEAEECLQYLTSTNQFQDVIKLTSYVMQLLLELNKREQKPFLFKNSFSFLKNLYFGGRTEVFDYELHHNVYHLDINSAYPYVLTLKLPDFTSKKRLTSLSVKRFYEISKSKFLIFNGMIKIHGPLSNVPIKIEKNVIFPQTGTFSGTWSSLDIDFETTEILKISSAYSFDLIDFPLLQKFVRELYSQRLKTTNKFEKALLKNFLVRIYGILGFSNPSFFRNRLIFCYITHFTRRYLYELIKLFYNNKTCKLIYTDTDSLVVKADSFDTIYSVLQGKLGADLGQISLRGVYDTFQAFRKKGYILTENEKVYIKASGLTKKDKQKFIENFDENLVTQPQP